MFASATHRVLPRVPVNYQRLISIPNLELAWRRITTATNHQYKRIYREQYEAYEVAHSANLRRLHQRLRGSWQPTPPTRIYLPKPSGLQRPIALLRLEDQIVQQAVANYFADVLGPRRRAVEGRTVFSNLLSRDTDSIFFLQSWQRTYRAFQETCRRHYTDGYRWIASFDLAAYYDTISHDLLVRVAAPRSHDSPAAEKVRAWLKCWSQQEHELPYRHGIPQGPVASDFLAEAFLLPLDEALGKDDIRYTRYVDDIRLFAKSKLEAQRAAIRLEVLCRNRGLIPQGKKFLIVEAKSLNEVLGQLPSLPPREQDGATAAPMTAEEAISLLRTSVGGRPRVIVDKSKLRYVMYRAPRSRRILGIVLRLLPRYPEHIDAFMAFLRLYQRSSSIEKALESSLRAMPNEYVRGELWRLLADIGSMRVIRRMVPVAKSDLAERSRPFWQRTGALAFLMKAENHGIGVAVGRLQHQPLNAQAILASRLEDPNFDAQPVVARLLRSEAYEVSMQLGARLVALRKSHRDFGLRVMDLAPETQATFRALGLLRRGHGGRIDPVGEILSRRYGIPSSTEWKRILGKEYVHCLQLLSQAEAAYEAARSNWLQVQNSFNDALTRRVISMLTEAGMAGGARTVNKLGQLVKFGSLVEASAPFDATFPKVAGPFRVTNDRRNHLPASHPYDEKTGQRNAHLKKGEQRTLHTANAGAYAELVVIMPGIPG